MNALLSVYTTSIGKKIVMSLTGLFFITFLVEHLIGNLLLFVQDHGAAYEAYGRFMVSNPIVRSIEILLFVSLGCHAFLGGFLWLTNKRTRPVSYERYRLSENTPIWSRTTILTGGTIFLFLLIHLRSFFVPIRFGNGSVSEYDLVKQAFANPWYSGFYILAFVMLAFHLRHGFQAAFQTLGLRNTTYQPLIDAIAILFWAVVPILYASIPIYFCILQWGMK